MLELLQLLLLLLVVVTPLAQAVTSASAGSVVAAAFFAATCGAPAQAAKSKVTEGPRLSKKMLQAKKQCHHKLLTPAAAPVDHTPGRFLIEPAAACAGEIFLLVFVQSAIHHRERRDLIRRTWASVSNIGGDRFATFFVVGRSSSKKEMQQVQQEAEETADLLQADFVDTYRNLTYKHLYAIKWIGQRCRSVRFVTKVDDDVSLNVFHLRDFLRDRLMDARNFILCQLNSIGPIRNKRIKWTVTMEEWPLDKYPQHCKGIGYVMSGDILPQLQLCAQWRKYFWIDDVFVTGALATAIGVQQLQFEDGWGVARMHPKFVGPEADRAVVLVSYGHLLPRLYQRVWNAMLQYSS